MGPSTMAGDLDYLEPRVGHILRAPGTDLSTISAKRVRRQLLELEPSLTAEYLKEHKEEVDAIISRVFEQVSAENAASALHESSDREGSSTSRKRHWVDHDDDDADDGNDEQEEEDDDDDEEDEEEEEEEDEKPVGPPPKKAKKSAKNGQKLSDEELARKLSNEINGRTTRTSGKTGGKGRATKGRTRKSAATIDSEGESDEVADKKSKKSKSSSSVSSGAKGGFKKEFALSEPLAAVVQVQQLARPQVVKQLWVYIKGHELQNPSNKREILCDSKLKAVFGVDKINMFTMNKVLGRHLHEIEES